MNDKKEYVSDYKIVKEFGEVEVFPYVRQIKKYDYTISGNDKKGYLQTPTTVRLTLRISTGELYLTFTKNNNQKMIIRMDDIEHTISTLQKVVNDKDFPKWKELEVSKYDDRSSTSAVKKENEILRKRLQDMEEKMAKWGMEPNTEENPDELVEELFNNKKANKGKK